MYYYLFSSMSSYKINFIYETVEHLQTTSCPRFSRIHPCLCINGDIDVAIVWLMKTFLTGKRKKKNACCSKLTEAL